MNCSCCRLRVLESRRRSQPKDDEVILVVAVDIYRPFCRSSLQKSALERRTLEACPSSS